jgi:hypothetical protein
MQTNWSLQKIITTDASHRRGGRDWHRYLTYFVDEFIERLLYGASIQ